MNRLIALGLLLSVLALTACGSQSAGTAGEVRQFVMNLERTVDDAISGKAEAATLEQYLASPEEGAHAEGLVNTRDAFRKVLDDYQSGVARVQLLNHNR